jgi:hypothetical protein
VQMDAAPTITAYNPSAASSSACYDVTAAASGGSVATQNASPHAFDFTCAGASGSAVGDELAVHFTVDSGL